MSKTILVADDSRTIQTAVTLTFRATQYKVVSVGDGDEALRKISELKPDLVLLDIGMPGRSGYELCSALKASPNTAAIPVLLLSGQEPVDDRRVTEARADGHIKKPFDSLSLIERANALTSAGSKPVDSMPVFPAPRPKTDAPMAPALAPALAPTPFTRPAGVAPMPKAPPPVVASAGSTASAPASGFATAGHGASGAPVGSGSWAPVAVTAPTPFGAPRAEARSPFLPEAPVRSEVVPFARPAVRSESVEEEPEYFESDVVEDAAEHEAVRRVPSLEPPRAPSGTHSEVRPNVDVWAMADAGSARDAARRKDSPSPVDQVVHETRAREASTAPYGDGGDALEEVEIFDVDGRSSPPAPRVSDLAAPMAAKVAGPIAAAAAMAVPGLPHDELVRIARDVIERIAWEVVPELAEAIIRAELERLTQD